jgi:hypothetical protein
LSSGAWVVVVEVPDVVEGLSVVVKNTSSLHTL